MILLPRIIWGKNEVDLNGLSGLKFDELREDVGLKNN